MNKPDWKDAPEWANYLAMDADGGWVWYENEPVKTKNESCKSSKGFIKLAFTFDERWKDSLETRPE